MGRPDAFAVASARSSSSMSSLDSRYRHALLVA
jgi:hypothetical protein